jgi:hypothetical protein
MINLSTGDYRASFAPFPLVDTATALQGVDQMCFHRVLGTFSTVLALATASRAPAQAAPDTASIAQATAAASVWVSLLDAGELEASWDSAAPAFQAAISKREWLQAVTRARGPFEPFGARTLVGAQF